MWSANDIVFCFDACRAMKRLESANDVKNHAEHLQEQLTIARADVISLETKVR